jgi:hypothetical protein
MDTEHEVAVYDRVRWRAPFGANSAANRALHESYSDDLRAAMETPYVIDTRLGKIVDEVYVQMPVLAAEAPLLPSGRS